MDVKEQFTEESNDLQITAGRTPTRGNWVSIEWCGFEIRVSDDGPIAISQKDLRDMCIRCLNTLFG